MNVDGLFQLGIIVAQARSQEEGFKNIAGSAGRNHRRHRGWTHFGPRCLRPRHAHAVRTRAGRLPDRLDSPSARRVLCPHLIGPTLTVP